MTNEEKRKVIRFLEISYNTKKRIYFGNLNDFKSSEILNSSSFLKKSSFSENDIKIVREELFGDGAGNEKELNIFYYHRIIISWAMYWLVAWAVLDTFNKIYGVFSDVKLSPLTIGVISVLFFIPLVNYMTKFMYVGNPFGRTLKKILGEM